MVGLIALSAVCACNTQIANPTQLVLNEPSDLAFGCVGFLAGDNAPHAFPPDSCGRTSTVESPDAGVPDAGGPLPSSPSAVFLIAERAPGVVHVATTPPALPEWIDQDAFAPGLNGLTVGRLPVSVAVTSDGCWGVVANSGSCDLTVIDVLRAALGKSNAIAARGGVAGIPARPGEVARPTSLPAGTFPPPTCDRPTGAVYVAYPACHLVARVDLATFRVVDGIRFRDGAPAEIVGPDVTCPAECTNSGASGAAAGGDAGPGGDVAQPVALAMQPKVSQHRVTSGSVTSTDHGSASTVAIGIPPSDRLYLVYVQARDDRGAVPTSTLAGAGLTWTQAETVTSADNVRRLSLFYATGRANGTPIAVTHSAATADATEWIVEDVIGADLTAPIRQVAKVTGTGPSASITLRGFAGDGNGTVAAFGVDVARDDRNNPIRRAIAQGSWWTEVDEVGSVDNLAGTLAAQFSRGPLPAAASWGCDLNGCPTYVALAAEVELQSTLYIGAGDSPRLHIVDLDATGAPLAVRDVPLEGAGGIRRLAASGPIAMGKNGRAGELSFVYAIGADQAIHVVDVTVGRTPTECDTQIDRRYLHQFPNPGRLACFHLGDPQNPPRRPDAVGPGIRLPAGVLPLDVTFADTEFFEAVPATADPLAPEFLRGNFAVVTALGPTASSPRGVAYWINIKDELYPDFQPGIDLYDPDIAFRLPHSLRDNIPFRWVPSFTCTEGNYRNNEGPYRIAAGFPLALSTGLATNATGKSGAEFAPNLHLVSAEKIVSTSTSTRDWCAGAGVVAYELSSLAPRELRSALWADATLVSPGETFTVAWEGSLAAGDLRSQKTGGRVTIADGGRMQLDASGANLCGLGAQQGDIVRLLGCAINADCAVDETCYLHPQAPVGVSGMCIPRDKVIEFSADCQSLLTSVRRYTIVDITDEGAVIAPRPRTLPETPLAGCTDTSQCEAIQEKVLSAREDAAGQARGTRARHAYACETDGPMGGSPRCIEVCDDQTACELGTTCERSPGQAMGRCLLGPMPPPKCIERLQRYELRAGEAFTVVSSVAGYRNRAVVDPGTKACVVDPQKSPLLVARFGRNEPPCADTGGTAISPNPCTLPPAVIDPADCTNVIGGFAEPVALTSGVCYRPTHAIRIRTPGVSFDVVDLSLPLDGFPGVRYSPIQFGYGFQVQVAGGGSPFIETAIQANLPSRLRRGLRGSLPWVIDSGSSPVAGGTRGQIIQLIGNASGGAAADVRLR